MNLHCNCNYTKNQYSKCLNRDEIDKYQVKSNFLVFNFTLESCKDFNLEAGNTQYLI